MDVFLVLSGYLITDLLTAHWNRHGRLDLRGFWARRARRLLPALAVLLVVVTAATAVIEPAQLAALRSGLLAAVTYSSNWWQALAHHSYFTRFGAPPPLQHLWSLAIEEQFYLVWPLLLIVILKTCRSRHIRAGLAWSGAALSALAMALVYLPGADPSRVYYGTDTHAAALFIGSALALTWPLRRLGPLGVLETRGRLETRGSDRTRVPDALGVAGIAVLAWAMGHFTGTDRVLYPAGLLVAALAAGGVVLAAASPGLVSWALSRSVLRWIGVRSYGIYLWHWPVIALATAAFPQQRPADWIWLPEAALSVGLAAASWRWVEEPIIRHGFRATVRARSRVVVGSLARAHRSPVGAVPALAVVAALVVTGAAGYGVLHAHSSTGLAEQISEGVKVSQQDPASRAALTPTAAPDCHADGQPIHRRPDRLPGRPLPGCRDAAGRPGRQPFGHPFLGHPSRSHGRSRPVPGDRLRRVRGRRLGLARLGGPAHRGTARHFHQRAGQPPGQRGPVDRPAARGGGEAPPGRGVRARHQRHVHLRAAAPADPRGRPAPGPGAGQHL